MTEATKRKRKRRPAAELRTINHTIWVNKAENDLIARAVNSLPMEAKPTAWMRHVVLEAARGTLGEKPPEKK